MAATATISRPSSPNPSVVLRAARLEEQKKRIGRMGSGDRRGLSMRPTPSNPAQEVERFRGNPTARIRADHHAIRRFANPGAMMPALREMSTSLREGDTGQEEDANDIDQQAVQIADESDAAQTMQLAARARSRTKSTSENAAQKMMEQAMKKGEELMDELKAEVTSKAGAADDGELLLIANTALTGMSILRSFMGIFSESLEKYNVVLSKVGLPVPKHLKLIGGMGTIAEIGIYLAVVFVILYILTFLALMYGTAGDILNGNLTNAYTVMKAAL